MSDLPAASRSCDQCPFNGQVRVGPEGDPSICKYVFVGEAPGYQEVKAGRPFVGRAGKIFDKLLKRAGIERSTCYITNAVKCKAPGNDVPRGVVTLCHSQLAVEISQVPEGVPIMVMGKTARESLLPEIQGGVFAGRGWHEGEDGRQYLCSVHPMYIGYNPQAAPVSILDFQRLKRGPQEPMQARHEIIETIEELGEWVFIMRTVWRFDKESRFVSYDLETDQVDFQRDRILNIAIGYAPGWVAIIPDSLLYEDGLTMTTTGWSKERWAVYLGSDRYKRGEVFKPRQDVVATLNRLFAIQDVRWVAQNSKFDMRFLHNYGVTNARCDFDTIVAHYALDERTAKQGGSHGLKVLLGQYFDMPDYEGDVLWYAGKKSGRYSKVPRDVLYKYAALDAEGTRRLAYALEEELKRQRLYERPFRFPLMASLETLLAMELRGLYVDVDRLDEADAAFAVEEERCADVLRNIAERPDLNPRSNPQIQAVVFDTLKIPMVRIRTRSRGQVIEGRTTRKEALDHWFQMGEDGKLNDVQVQFVRALKDYRHAQKMRGSYVKNLRKFLGTDGCVHASYLLRGTVTGRLSAKDPAVQTFPSNVDDELGMKLSSCVRARPGWKFLYADYSQMELRVLASLSGDPNLIEMLSQELSIHDVIAEKFYGPNYTSEQRNWYVKRAVYGWAYGGDVESIIKEALVVAASKAKWFATEWAKQFSVAIAWRKGQHKQMLEKGYVEGVLGHRRRFAMITKDNRIEAMLAAINFPNQNGAAVVTLISAVRLHEMYKSTDYAYVVLNVHDSNVIEVREDKAEEVAPVMEKVMVETAEKYFPGIRFDTEVHIADSLGDLK